MSEQKSEGAPPVSRQSLSLRVVLAQLDFYVGDVVGNVTKIVAALRRARDELHAHAIVFSELTLTGYPPEDLLLRPHLHQQVLRGLEELTSHVTGIDVVVGYPNLDVKGLHNAASLIRDGKIVATYHKQHLPNYSVFDEKRYFQSGDAPCVVNIQGVPVAITICEDMWHPGPMAQARVAGARLMLNLNASPFHIGKGSEREDVLRQRVTEGAMPIVYVNLVGGQDELVFDGESLVMDANGTVVMRASPFVEELYAVDFSVNAIMTSGITPLAGICHAPLSIEAGVYRALVLGTRDYIEKNGFRGVLIGSSGGIDSALTLAIAVDAIGKERVEAVMMPSRYTAQMSLDDAQALSGALGVEHHVISIEPAFQAFLSSLEQEFAGTQADTTEENIQARCRGVLLMALANKSSNKERKMVLSTGNKSEMSVGYATLYGDMAGGFAVIKDVPKTLVYRLAAYRNAIASVIPQRIFERPPTAELAPNQKDEDSLPPYAVLDPILEMYIEQDKSLQDIIVAGYDEATVRRVMGMVNRNEYKRRQAPPGVRITRRAFGRDRRYPITAFYSQD